MFRSTTAILFAFAMAGPVFAQTTSPAGTAQQSTSMPGSMNSAEFGRVFGGLGVSQLGSAYNASNTIPGTSVAVPILNNRTSVPASGVNQVPMQQGGTLQPGAQSNSQIGNPNSQIGNVPAPATI